LVGNIQPEDLEEFLAARWSYIDQLRDGRVVVRKLRGF